MTSLATSTINLSLKTLEPVVSTVTQPQVAEASFVREETLQEKAEKIAKEHNVSFEIMDRIISDESKYKPDAVGAAGELGVAQIYLKYHPDVTPEQAKDPIFSFHFLAKELEDGKEYQHTICNCRSEANRLGAKIPTGVVKPNTPFPRVGGVVIFDYNGVPHYAYIDSVEVDGIHISEANFIKCARSKRVIAFDDPNIVGYRHSVN